MSRLDCVDTSGPGSWVLWTLQNFDSDLDEVMLPGEVRIMRLSTKDAQTIVDAADPNPEGADEDPAPQFALLAPYERGHHFPRQEMGSMEKVSIAMRLIKPGCPVVSLEVHPEQDGLFVWRNYGDASQWRWLTPYVLKQPEHEVLSHLVLSLSDIANKHPELARALGRFDSLYSRASDEDRILDLWIALEALFLSDSRSGELRFRAALRAAHYCGDSPNDRWQTFSTLRESYDFRSLVIHGSKVDHGKLGLAVNDTWAIVRTTIRKALLARSRIDLEGLDRLAVLGEASDPGHTKEQINDPT